MTTTTKITITNAVTPKSTAGRKGPSEPRLGRYVNVKPGVPALVDPMRAAR